MRESIFVALLVTFSSLISCKEEPVDSSAAAEKAEASSSPAPPEAEPKKDEPPPWSNRLSKNSGFPCEVEKVLARSCRRCHWQPREYDAPFSLLTWDDTRGTRTGKPIFELMKKQVSADLMPPVLEVVADPPVEALTAEQKKTLLDWLEAGAEKSDETCP